MMNRQKVLHILRAIATISGESKLVLVGSATVLMRARNIPAEMLNTNEIDVFAPESNDEEMFADLIEGSIGRGSHFDRTFNYFGDGVSSKTATMPHDWKDRAVVIGDHGIANTEVIVPDLNDIALAKLVAWREKDRVWLEAGVRALILKPASMRERLDRMPEVIPRAELERRLTQIEACLTD
jgi:hypothetical protein